MTVFSKTISLEWACVPTTSQLQRRGHATYLETQRCIQSLHTLHIRYYWTPKARSARPILEEFYTPGCSRGRRGCDAASHPS